MSKWVLLLKKSKWGISRGHSYDVYRVGVYSGSPICVKVLINEAPLTIEVCTGAFVYIVSEYSLKNVRHYVAIS